MSPTPNPVFNFNFESIQYDTAGNCTRITVAANAFTFTDGSGVFRGAPNPSGTLYFAYDSQDRLIGEKRTSSVNLTNYYIYSYGTFDANGNLLSPGFTYDAAENLTTLRTQSLGSLTYNANNQLSGTGFSYDFTVAAIQYRGNFLTYDVEARVKTIANSSNSVFYRAGYRSDGLRAWVKGAGAVNYYIYDGDVVLYELQLSGVNYIVKQLYGWGPDGLSQRCTPGTTYLYRTYVYDPFGNVGTQVRLQSNNGVPDDVAVYDSLGRVIADVSTGSPFSANNNFSYPIGNSYSVGFGGAYGGYKEISSRLAPTDNGDRGLILEGSRYYDPNYGRHTTRGSSGTSPNLYTTPNNPTLLLGGMVRFDQGNEIVQQFGQQLSQYGPEAVGSGAALETIIVASNIAKTTTAASAVSAAGPIALGALALYVGGDAILYHASGKKYSLGLSPNLEKFGTFIGGNSFQ